MALRSKTAREEWATRYRGGKRSPRETAITLSGVPVSAHVQRDQSPGVPPLALTGEG